MKRFALFMAIAFASCGNPCKVKENINVLKKQQETEQAKLTELKNTNRVLEKSIQGMMKKLSETKAVASGNAKYILKFHLKQTHLTLSLKEHAKDALNAVDFEMSVSKEMYDHTKVGQDIVNGFRAGSLVLRGSFGNWKMTVSGKEIR